MPPATKSVTQIEVDAIIFSPTVKHLGRKQNSVPQWLRGLEIEGKFVKFTAIGVYLEDEVVPLLADKWKGATAKELTNSVEFFRYIVKGPFEKLIRVTMILPLKGKEYSEKVKEKCVACWKSEGIFTYAESKAFDRFLAVFRTEEFPPGCSILFTILPQALAISFSKDGSIPRNEDILIDNELLSEAILESIISKHGHGVPPELRQSMASRLADLFEKSEPSFGEMIREKVQNTKLSIEKSEQSSRELIEKNIQNMESIEKSKLSCREYIEKNIQNMEPIEKSELD